MGVLTQEGRVPGAAKVEVENGFLTTQFLAWHLYSFLRLLAKYHDWMTYYNLFSHRLEA